MKIEKEAIGSVVSPVKEPVNENWGKVFCLMIFD
jgi:hypothetical protein